MKKDNISIQDVNRDKYFVVDYSDDDVAVIDNVRMLADWDTTRVMMNLVCFVIQGKVQFSMNGKKIEMCDNQLLICPPNTMMSDIMHSLDFEFKAFCMTNRILQNFLHEKIKVWTDVLYIHKMHVITMDVKETRLMTDYINLMHSLMSIEKQNAYHSYVIQALLRSAVLALCGSLKYRIPEKEQRDTLRSESYFQRFLDMINDNIDKYHTVADYANKLCITPKYLSAICKRSTGKTANEWISERLLEEIRFYLEQTDLSIKQISDQLGFSNPSFFGKYVKANIGMSPTRFRNKNL